MLNRNVAARVDLRDVDIACLDLLVRGGELSPSALARGANLHPATLTGVLDRLEQAGWIARRRDTADRRSVVIAPLGKRAHELVQLYAGMNTEIDRICAGYNEGQLALIVEFLTKLAEAGRTANERLMS